jgi:uncharacterized membrane protein
MTGTLRFGAELPAQERSVQWLLKRNCSIAPRQLAAVYLVLSGVSLAIGAAFWLQGATLVLPFAGAELLAVGVALLIHARHATDLENIRLDSGRLTVEHVFGHQVRRAEFAPQWVRVEPQHGERSLIELSGQGQSIAVGRFVRPELRRQLAEELRWAVRGWPRPVDAPAVAGHGTVA